MKNKYLKVILLITAVISIIFIIGCGKQVLEEQQIKENTKGQFESTAKTGEETLPEKTAIDWKNIELKDVSTARNFKISDFKGKPILIESFAVWCPVCLEQQKKMKELKQQEGGSIIHISLDTDPNEDEPIVKGHIEKNNLDWLFAVAPTDLTKSLINEFGVTIVNAPSAPVILVCEDQKSRLLGFGVKSAEKLKKEIKEGC